MSTDSGSTPGTTGNGPAVGDSGRLVRLRLDIAYDGTDFSGWAVQPGRRTVAGVLGDALALLFRGPVPLVVAGRTDAGVHAAGQVAHIDVDPRTLHLLTPRRRGRDRDRDACDVRDDPEGRGDCAVHDVHDVHDARDACAGLLRRLAGLLPADLRVSAAARPPDGFDARFSALRRHYRYRIGTAAWGVNPLDRTDVLGHGRPLDAAAMDRAATTLLGLRDFATFCKARPRGTTIRELQELSVTASGEHEVVVRVAADAFCHSMVRSLVGVLIAVGDGRMAVSEPAAMLAARRRTGEVYTAPARGLTLVEVDYPPDAELAARAMATRAMRSAAAGSAPGPAAGDRSHRHLGAGPDDEGRA